jgi:hypothetical protein
VVGVTHAQDKRLRRFLLNKEGLPTPPGITFSSRGSKDLARFISRHGYPVVLKEAIGENPSHKIDNILNDEDLTAAVATLRVRSADQLAPAQSLVTSAYAENILNLDVDEEGKRIVPSSARLLIEKRVSGRYIRCLVCDKRLLSAIELDESDPGRTALRDDIHPDFETVALTAATVFPGLSVASVDFVVEDPTRSLETQAYYIVELCERPRLDSFMRASPSLGSRLAEELLLYQARQSSVQIQPANENIATRVRVENLSEPSALLDAVCNISSALMLKGFVGCVDAVEGIIEGHMEGAPSAIALLMEALMSGVHFGQRATAAEAWQATMEDYADFRLA